MTQRIEFSLQVGSEHAGKRLDQAADQLIPDVSRARLQKWIRDGQLTIDGRRAKPSRKLAGGEQLRLDAELEPEGAVLPEAIPLDVLFEDQDLLVLNKPAGLVVHPAAGHPSGTLQNALLHHRPALDQLPRSGIVHRLDKDTTGVMVVAASLRAHTHLVDQLQTRTMGRVYEAVATGVVQENGTVNAPIGRHPRDRIRMAVVADGKPAVSHFRILERFKHFTQVEVSLESGRTHQIRVHFQHLGHPLIADPLYGRSLKSLQGLTNELRLKIEEFPRQALHARTLRLIHPGSGEGRSFHAPLPEDFKELLGVLSAQDVGL